MRHAKHLRDNEEAQAFLWNTVEGPAKLFSFGRAVMPTHDASISAASPQLTDLLAQAMTISRAGACRSIRPGNGSKGYMQPLGDHGRSWQLT